MKNSLNRRTFVKNTSALLAGLGAGLPAFSAKENSPEKEKKYNWR
ncbi:MAG: twin-arginine translocation signal domain-containing protein [Bacteroidia bacterium]